jgi:hypothetical protein
MKFILKIDCNNAAFHGDDDEEAIVQETNHEVARILQVVTKQLLNAQDEGKIFDVNGNAVGEYYFELP